MIDHIGLTVADYGRSKAFYGAALAPLGYVLVMEVTEAGPYAGFGEGGKPDFWIGRGTASAPRVHVAFRASDRATVHAFHEAALAAGAQDNGPPGIRTEYHPIEAVCHEPEWGRHAHPPLALPSVLNEPGKLDAPGAFVAQ